MARRNLRIDPLMVSGRIGLAVMENAFQRGHIRLLMEMKADCDESIVAFGSSQLHGIDGHPFTFEQKKAMVEGVFGGGAFRFTALQDIDASVGSDDWATYVLDRVAAMEMPAPTDYYCGSEIDARPYTSRFAKLTDTKTTNGPITTFESPLGDKRLQILDRSLAPELRGRDVRYLIEQRDPQWQRYVPAKLWAYIEATYPPHLRVALRGDGFPGTAPVGTRFIDANDPDKIVYMLRDDGKWRPISERPDDKAGYRPVNAR
jgi:hypothetical protein